MKTEVKETKAALPPAVILGGEANALSVARCLSRLGVRVYLLSEPDTCARHSRHCQWLPLEVREGEEAEDAFARTLLGPECRELAGAVVLACNDAGIQALIRHREALSAVYRLDESNPKAQIEMLDKLSTYRHAVAAGVPTPKFWVAESRAQVLALRDELVFPLLVKPRLAHRAKKSFKTKHRVVQTFDELLAAFDAEREAAVDVLLMEEIPGPDSELCSYYTYLDEAGNALFDFTKRMIRRYPTGMGLGCYHVTDRVPQIVEPARRLFRQAGLRGLANVEFKRDPRDGQYKVIECNARFTAADCLVGAAGYDLGAFVYRRAVGLPQPPMGEYKVGLHLWDPLVDLMAAMELRRKGDLTLLRWLGGAIGRQTFPYFRWSDPMPAVARLRKMLKVAGGGRKPRAAKSVEIADNPPPGAIPAPAASGA